MLKHPIEEIQLCQRYIREEHPTEDPNDSELINSLLDDPRVSSVLQFFKKSALHTLPPSIRPATDEESQNFLLEEKGRKNLEKVPRFVSGGAWDEWLASVLPILHKEWAVYVKINIIRSKLHPPPPSNSG